MPNIDTIEKIPCDRLEFDVVVIGSGGAGSAAAQSALEEGLRVLVVSKDPINCSDSKISEGIVTVRGSGSDKDSKEELQANLHLGGNEISDPDITNAFANDSADAYDWLRSHGIKCEINEDTDTPICMVTPMGGHSLPRSIDHENDGRDFAHACWSALMQETSGGEQITYLEDAWFLDIYVSDDTGAVRGGLIYHASEGKFISISAPVVILACGGLSTLYFPHTDTMRGNTGDSYAIAARAGAALVDMEQIQFIPYSICSAPTYEGLVVGEPISAGFMGVVRDVNGKIIQRDLMLKTRAECASAIALAVANGNGTINGGCYLDLTKNIEGKSGPLFTAIMTQKAESLIKIVKAALGAKAARFEEQWEVRPSAHYCMGGVQCTAQCEALDKEGNVILGLYVAGQVLGGLHGSNRLGSTSLAEGVIFGRRAGKIAKQYLTDVFPTNSRTGITKSLIDFAKIETRILNKYNGFLAQNGKKTRFRSYETFKQLAGKQLVLPERMKV